MKYLEREILFRESVLAFLGVGEYSTEARAVDDYCRACKYSRKIKEGEEDEKCKTCSKEIKVVSVEDKSKEKTFGKY